MTYPRIGLDDDEGQVSEAWVYKPQIICHRLCMSRNNDSRAGVIVLSRRNVHK